MFGCLGSPKPPLMMTEHAGQMFRCYQRLQRCFRFHDCTVHTYCVVTVSACRSAIAFF